MSRILIAISVLFAGGLARADHNVYFPVDSCTMSLNMELRAGPFGDPKFSAPFYFDHTGKIVETDRLRIKNKKVDGSSEIVEYTVMEHVYGSEKPVEVRRKLTVQRGSDKKIKRVVQDKDLKTQIEQRKSQPEGWFTGIPLVKSTESNFHYNGRDCNIEKKVATMLPDEKSKEVRVVTYDKKFCDSVEPMLREMGTQNAAKCGTFVLQAQSVLNARNKELAKSGEFIGHGKYKSDDGSALALSSVIQMCLTFNGFGGGMGGYSPYGGGMMPYGYGDYQGAPQGQSPAKPGKGKGTIAM